MAFNFIETLQAGEQEPIATKTGSHLYLQGVALKMYAQCPQLLHIRVRNKDVGMGLLPVLV